MDCLDCEKPPLTAESVFATFYLSLKWRIEVFIPGDLEYLEVIPSLGTGGSS